MNAIRRISGAIAVALAFGFLPRPATADQSIPATVADYPVVLELCTSEGCNSCLPADALLGRLAQRHDLLPLALYIDYWDYLGWKDPCSSKFETTRQSAYGRLLDVMVYTPQMAVDGARDTVLTVLRGERGELKVALPAGEGQSAPASVYEVLFDSSHVTSVGRGENSGRTLTEFNIVREWRKIGEWTGRATEFPVSLGPQPAGFDACAIILQEGSSGPIRGATAFRLR